LQDIDESNPDATSIPSRIEPTLVDAPPLRVRSFAEQWRQAGLSRPREGAAYAPSYADPATPVQEPAPAHAVPPVRTPEFSFTPEPAIDPPAFATQLRNEPGWFDRWGRKAATWGLGLAGVVLLAGAGVWLYEESKLDHTLAAVAKSSPQVSDSAPVAATPPAPASSLPQLVMLNEAPAQKGRDAAPPPEGVAEVKEAAAGPLDVAEVKLKDGVPVLKDSKPARSARVVAAAVPPRKAKREKVEARAAAPAAATEVAERASQLALTLKQCRIEGYAAKQCLKRGCVLTKYGLACRG
jgi:hypothetical protein